MGIYLDKLRSTLTEVQTAQITNLLLKQKDSGEIRNLEEFRAKLTELTSKLLEDKISPSFQLFIGKLETIIDSDTYNFMLERIRDDLETIFNESNTLSEVIDAHINLINNVVLRAIKLGLAELDNKVSMYEFLARDTNGFTGAQFNTFKAIQQLSTSRSAANSTILFTDPRSLSIVENDAIADPIGERLTLGTSENKIIDIKSARQIFDSEATQSEELVQFSNSDINNILDNSLGTYWFYSILQKQQLVDGITSKIELSLSNIVDINFIEFETASSYPMTLVRIDYFDTNNILQSIPINEILTKFKKVQFNKITTNKLIIVVQQINALELQYEQKPRVNNFVNALSSAKQPVDTDSIETEIRNTITSSRLLNDILAFDDTRTIGSQKKHYDYTIGFDNIRVGYGVYIEESIFTSSQLNVFDLRQIALKAKELRPIEIDGVITMTNDTYPVSGIIADSMYFHGSNEYWALLQNFSDDDLLIDIDTVPLTPIGVERIYHERLVLTHKVHNSTINNAGRLIHYASTLEANLDEIDVYRNGTLLVRGDDWDITPTNFESVDADLTNDIVSPTGKPNRIFLHIFSPLQTDYYTVSYTPLLSNTRITPHDIFTAGDSLQSITSGGIVIDLIGDASATIGQNNIVYINPNKNNGKITSYTKINLIVILRRNSSNLDLTPTVEEYLLLTSSANVE